MSTYDTPAQERTDAQITGPHPEFDKYDRPTGVYYYRCTGCGREAVRRRVLVAHECR